MGDPFEVFLWTEAFQLIVDEWQCDLAAAHLDAGTLKAYDPIAFKTVDLSLCQYADDLLKMFFGDGAARVETFAATACEASRFLSRRLRLRGCAQNEGKQVALLALLSPRAPW